MIRRPPRSTRTDTLFPYTTLFRSLPICYYGARYGVDMDLLTRGAGFGYLGSTITSAVYASFTFILFAIEAVILSAALQLCFGIPLPIGHIISAPVVVPIAAYGFRRLRSEERRVGKECVRRWRSRWSRYN